MNLMKMMKLSFSPNPIIMLVVISDRYLAASIRPSSLRSRLLNTISYLYRPIYILLLISCLYVFCCCCCFFAVVAVACCGHCIVVRSVTISLLLCKFQASFHTRNQTRGLQHNTTTHKAQERSMYIYKQQIDK